MVEAATPSEMMIVNKAVTLNSLVHRSLIDAFYLATPGREAERCFDNLLGIHPRFLDNLMAKKLMFLPCASEASLAHILFFLRHYFLLLWFC